MKKKREKLGNFFVNLGLRERKTENNSIQVAKIINPRPLSFQPRAMPTMPLLFFASLCVRSSRSPQQSFKITGPLPPPEKKTFPCKPYQSRDAFFASPTHPRYVYSQTPQPMGSLLPPFISKRAANPDPPSPLLSSPFPSLPRRLISSPPPPPFPSLPPFPPSIIIASPPAINLGSRPMASRPGPSLMPPCESREKMGGGEKKENYTPGQTALSRGWKRCSDLWCGREEVVVSTALEIDSTLYLDLGNFLDKVEVISTVLEVGSTLLR